MPRTRHRRPARNARDGFTVRHVTPGDVDAIVQIFAGPKAVWGTLQLPFPSTELWRKRLTELQPGLVALVACADAEPIGMLGLHTEMDHPRRRHAAHLGMAVRDDWQGRGAGTALVRAALDLADHWLNLARLELHVYTDNNHAIRLYKRFGFEVEGTLRQYAFRDGRFVDAYLMSRLRP